MINLHLMINISGIECQASIKPGLRLWKARGKEKTSEKKAGRPERVNYSYEKVRISCFDSKFCLINRTLVKLSINKQNWWNVYNNWLKIIKKELLFKDYFFLFLTLWLWHSGLHDLNIHLRINIWQWLDNWIDSLWTINGAPHLCWGMTI